MICADTSSFVAFTKGGKEADVELVEQAMAGHLLVLAPASIAELLSDPNLSATTEELVLQTRQLEILPGYWERTGKLRALMFRNKFRPKLADALIAQCCLDHDVPLITRDMDFRPFEKLAGLRLL